jgi:hypothetical protein
MRPMYHSVLDNIDINNPNLYFHPNQIVRPRKPSRGKYDVYNYVSESPEIKEEEEELFENDSNADTYSDFIWEFNFIHQIIKIKRIIKIMKMILIEEELLILIMILISMNNMVCFIHKIKITFNFMMKIVCLIH